MSARSIGPGSLVGCQVITVSTVGAASIYSNRQMLLFAASLTWNFQETFQGDTSGPSGTPEPPLPVLEYAMSAENCPADMLPPRSLGSLACSKFKADKPTPI